MAPVAERSGSLTWARPWALDEEFIGFLEGLGFRVYGLGFRVQGLGFRI